MNTCGTCKYFGPLVGQSSSDDPEDTYVPKGYHRCKLIEQRDNYEAPTAVALVTDASDFYAALCVKEEFGCNQWEAREDLTLPPGAAPDPQSSPTTGK